MADQFVFLRIVRMNGVDLNLFRHDYDLTWMGYFINADGRIYARYGGRDAVSGESRVSKEGLIHAMKESLRLHQEAKDKKLPPLPVVNPRKPEDFPSLKGFAQGRSCIRCHMVNEAFNAEAKRKGPIKPDERTESFFAFPLPETIGLKPDLVLGNRILEVKPDSPVDKAGLKKDDVVRTFNGMPIVTAYDMQYALNELVTDSKLTIEAERAGKPVKAEMQLPAGWKRWDASWRRSLWNVQPSLGFGGDDLTEENKKEKKLPLENFAYQLRNVNPNGVLGRAGLKWGDIIVSIDGKRKLPYSHFKGYIPLVHQPGDEIELIYMREGAEKKVRVTWK
jgi:hypothetical protein